VGRLARGARHRTQAGRRPLRARTAQRPTHRRRNASGDPRPAGPADAGDARHPDPRRRDGRGRRAAADRRLPRPRPPSAAAPAPRSLPLVAWTENCSSSTRAWWAAQDWMPAATVRAEDDETVLAMVAGGLGMAVMPALSLTGAPATIRITDLGPRRPTRTIGY